MPDSNQPLQVVVMIGSLRKESFNRKLFNAVVKLAPEGMTLKEIRIDDLPHYNEDLDGPQPLLQVARLREEIGEADAVLVISPEYNYSFSGVIKNAIDWASRPGGSSALASKPGAIMGAATGRSGTMRMQIDLRKILVALDMRLVGKPEVFLTYAGKAFDDNGELTDHQFERQITELLQNLHDWTLLMQSQSIEDDED